MKKDYRKMLWGSAAALICMSSLGAPLTARAEGEVYVGYVNPQETVYPYTGFSNSSDTGGDIWFMVRVDAEKFTQFDGQQLTGLRVGWGMGAETLSPEMEVFVRDSQNGANLASGKNQVEFGWNDVMFDAPYTVSKGKDLYLGCKVAWEPGSWFGTGIYGYSLPENSQFVSDGALDGSGNMVWNDMTDNSMTMMILGIVQTAGEGFNDLGDLTALRANDLQSLENPGNAWFVIHNQGVNAITSFEISGQLGSETWSYPVELSRPIDGNSSASVGGPVQALGSGTHQFWLSKVNGKEVREPSKIDLDLIGIPESVAQKYNRRPLVEYWVSESNYRTPIYVDDWMVPGLEPVRDKMSVAAHHISDQFMTYIESSDPEIDCEEVQMLLDMANGDKSRVYAPSFSVDRSFIPENPLAKPGDSTIAYNFINPEFVGTLYDAAMKVPTFVSVEAGVTKSPGTCTVEVKGNVEPGLLDNEPLYLSVYLVENGIESNSQEFPDDEAAAKYEGKYTHNDLIRTRDTALYGVKLDGTGAFSKTVNFELEDDWNADNMRVIAFVNRDGKNFNHAQVLNSVEVPLNPAGIGAVKGDSDVSVMVSGRDILVRGDYTEATAYSISGARTGLRSLQPGIYVVKVAAGTGNVVRKVVVR